jgi:hypothetical protein
VDETGILRIYSFKASDISELGIDGFSFLADGR